MKYIEVKDSGNISTQAVITYFFEQEKCFGFIHQHLGHDLLEAATELHM
jgi:hypothetical protein